MKRGLQIVLFILSLIPLYFAVTGFMGGAAGLNGGEAVAADLDNQFRYLSAFYLLLTFLIWYIIPAPEQHTGIFRMAILAIFLGGLARAYSYFYVGTPQPSMMAGMFLELGAPLLAVWQNMVTKNPS